MVIFHSYVELPEGRRGAVVEGAPSLEQDGAAEDPHSGSSVVVVFPCVS